MDKYFYITAAALGLGLSYTGIIFARLSGPSFTWFIAGLLLIAHIWSFVYARKKAVQNKGSVAALTLISPLFIVMGIVLALTLSLSGCENKVKWQEEVKLSTGEIITIDREIKYADRGPAWLHGQGFTPKEYIIHFKYPAQTGSLIEWRSTKLDSLTYAELPLVLDLGADKGWFIFTRHSINAACSRYVKYQFQNGVWMEPPLAEVIETLPLNLFLAADSNEIEGLISLADKTKENSDSGYSTDLKQVGPKSYWCENGYNGPYPPVETPTYAPLKKAGWL